MTSCRTSKPIMVCMGLLEWRYPRASNVEFAVSSPTVAPRIPSNESDLTLFYSVGPNFWKTHLLYS